MHRLQGAIIRPRARRIRGFDWALGASAVLVLGSLWTWHALRPAGPPAGGDAAILEEIGALSRTLMETIIAANAAYHDPERIGLVYPEGRFQIGLSGVQETLSFGAERLCRASLELTTPYGFQAARIIEYRVIQNDDGAKSFAWLRARDNLEELNGSVMGPFCKAASAR
jgi:hypothetical protein